MPEGNAAGHALKSMTTALQMNRAMNLLRRRRRRRRFLMRTRIVRRFVEFRRGL
jgi:hypothetical protein